MQPVIHFLISIVAGLGVGLHLDDKKKKYFLLCAMAVAAAAIDLDHILPIYERIGVKIVHNVFVFVILPVTIFLVFMQLEKKKEGSIRQRASLILCVMFIGHMFTDAITSGVPLYYPFTSARFTLMEMGIVLDARVFNLTSWQMVMILWGAMILFANLVETAIFKDVDGKSSAPWNMHILKPGAEKMRNIFPSIIEKIPFIRTQPVQGFEAYEEMRHKEVNLGQYDAAAEYIFNFVDNLRNQ